MARRAGAEEKQGAQRRGEGGREEKRKERLAQGPGRFLRALCAGSSLFSPMMLREVLGLLDTAPLGAEVPRPGLLESSEDFHNSECPVPGLSGWCDKSEGFWKMSPFLKLPSG